MEDETNRSSGWWVFPDGHINEMVNIGDHGYRAHDWLSDHDPKYDNEDYDEAIELLIQSGGVRVATFHGSDSMGVDLPDTLLPVVRNALLGLMRETRSDFNQYFLGGRNPKSLDFRGAVMAVRQAP